MTVAADWDCDWWDASCPWHGLHTLLDPVRIPRFRAFLEPLGPAPRILDVGAGAGFVTEELAAAGCRMVALDPELHTGVALRGDGERLPFPDRCFDGVVLSEVLEHTADWRPVVDEAVRVTRPGGRIVVSGPNRTLASWLVLILFAQQLPPTRVLPADLHSWRRFVTPDELGSRLGARGAVLSEVSGVILPAGHLVEAVAAWWGLRRRRISYAEAGERVKLAGGASTRIAYLGWAQRS